MFKKQATIAINISDSSIEALQLNDKKEALAFGRVALGRGIVENGEIIDKEKLAQSIISLLKNTKPNSLDPERYNLKALVNLPESQVFVNESKENIPFDPENIYVDSIEINFKPVLYIAVLKQVVDRYVSVIKMAGVDPVVLGIQSSSLGRALLGERYNLKTKVAAAIFYINSLAGSLSFFNGENVLSMSVSISIEGNKLAIKEIIDAILYYEDKTGEVVGEIILVANSELLPKVKEYISSNLGKTVITANPLENIKSDEILRKEKDQSLLASVIGLALCANEDLSLGINLLPEAINVEERYKYIRGLVVRISDIVKELRRSMLFGVSFVTVAFIFLGLVVYFYILKSPEKTIQHNMPRAEPELKIIVPQDEIILDASSTEYRGFRELLQEEEE